MDSLAARQLSGRGITPAERLQIRGDDLARDAVIGMQEGQGNAPLALRRLAPTLPSRRHMANGGADVAGSFLLGSPLLGVV